MRLYYILRSIGELPSFVLSKQCGGSSQLLSSRVRPHTPHPAV